MDDEAAMIAKRVADAVDAWMSAPDDTEAYRRLVVARGEWRVYRAPMIDLEAGDELLDQLAEQSRPMSLAEGLADLETALRRQARRAL
ncbi:hypothetical protein GCM10028801_03500 [Nocardioides maradonensis]